MFLRIQQGDWAHNMPMRIRDKKKVREKKCTNELNPVNGGSSYDTLEPSMLETGELDTNIFTSSLPETGKGAIKSDVLGSYTGTGVDDSAPVQDADDL